MQISIYTDGGAIGNPGPAAYAYIIYKDSLPLLKESQFIGRSTNNFAEYTGLIRSLEKVKDLIFSFQPPASSIVIYSDSSLMVNQLNGLFKVKNDAIRDFIFKIRGLENDIGIKIIYKHILREQNFEADLLVKNTLKKSLLTTIV